VNIQPLKRRKQTEEGTHKLGTDQQVKKCKQIGEGAKIHEFIKKDKR